jgi:hypothetical protein
LAWPNFTLAVPFDLSSKLPYQLKEFTMKFLRVALCLGAFVTLAVSFANAQATRTWVSGVGDDANPCSRTAPCKTFAGAISKTAAGGEIDALDPGGFGALTITKSITIDGGGGQVASVLVSGTNGITVAAGNTDNVTIRNLQFQGIQQSGLGGLNGIELDSAGSLHIEHCSITSFAHHGIAILSSTGSQVFIDDTVSRDNLGNGLNVLSTSLLTTVNVSNSHFSHNANGVVSSDLSSVTVRNSDATGNSAGGFVAQGISNTTTLNLVDSTASHNLGQGVLSGGGGAVSTLVLSNDSLFDNTAGISCLSNCKIHSFGNNANTNSSPTITKLTLE